MRVRAVLAAAIASVSLSAATHAALIIDDFSGGVTAANHPNAANGGTDAFGVYYDVADNAFGAAAAGTLNSSAALRITDGGFTNGVYVIYESVVPADGVYTVSADILVNDTDTSDMTAYQIGVIVNGAHRGANPSKIADATIFGDYTGLTADVLDATTIQNVVTSTFFASAGDNLLIAFSTDVTGGYDSNAGLFNSATIDVDNIMLNAIPEPSTLALVGLGLVGLTVVRRRR